MKLPPTNPTQRPASSRQKIAWALYLIFLLTSVWATGESLTRSTHLPVIFCLLVGLAALSGASFCLSLIKRSLHPQNPRRGKGFLIGLIGFLFLWSVTFVSNTHNLYFVGTIDHLRRDELNKVSKALEVMNGNVITAFTSAKTKFESTINSEIQNLTYEIINPGDPGQGKVADAICGRIAQLLGTNVDLTDPVSNAPADLQRHAAQMAQKIEIMKAEKLRSIELWQKNFDALLNSDRYRINKENVQNAIDQFDVLPEQKVVQIIRNSYAFYSECFDQVNTMFEQHPFLKEYTDLDLDPLPEVPQSIDLENIATSWQKFFRHEFDTMYFYLALAWALTIEIACFILFYYGVLSPKNEDFLD